MLDGEAAKGALDRLVLLFVPVFNVDGHENFRAWNRPNQRGPEEMGSASPRSATTSTAITRRPTRRNAGHAATGRCVGPGGGNGPARHRRREIPTRRFDHRRTGQFRRRGVARDRARGARRAGVAPEGAGLAAAGVLSRVRGRRRPGFGLRRRRSTAALLERLFPAAQPRRHPGRNAFVEGLPTRVRITHATPSSTSPTWPPGRRAMARRRTRRGPAFLAIGRKAGRAGFQGHRQGPHHRFPRLCLHAHAVRGFRRADDALRRIQARSLEDPAARRGSRRCCSWTRRAALPRARGVGVAAGAGAAAARDRIPPAGCAAARGRGREPSASTGRSSMPRPSKGTSARPWPGGRRPRASSARARCSCRSRNPKRGSRWRCWNRRRPIRWPPGAR